MASLFQLGGRMEVERQRYVATVGPDGEIGADRKVGPTERFEWGAATDAMSKAIGGAYISSWNVDFLQRELGQDGTCARFYLDRKVAVDVGDPESKVSMRKRKLLFRHGFGYLCVPSGYATSVEKLIPLYQACLEEYRHYEKLHPRPAVLQEAVVIDQDGRARRALVTAQDTIVGGGISGSMEQQQRELALAQKLSKKELRQLKLQSRMRRKLRRAIQNGTPFRNPFIAKGKRLFPVVYAS